MTTKEKEIQDYLISRNYSVDQQDFIARFLNCNYEIEDIGYNTNTDLITILTPNTEFTFKWNL